MARKEKDVEIRGKDLERKCEKNQIYLACFTILPKISHPPQFNPEEGVSQKRSDQLIMVRSEENIYFMSQKKHVWSLSRCSIQTPTFVNILIKSQRISKFVWDFFPCGRDSMCNIANSTNEFTKNSD